MRIGDLNSVRADLMSELDSLEAVKANVLGSHPEGQGLGGPDQEDAGELHLPVLQP